MMTTRKTMAYSEKAGHEASSNMGFTDFLGTCLVVLMAVLIFCPVSIATAGPLDIEIGARAITATPVGDGTKFVSPYGGGNQSGNDAANPMPFRNLDVSMGGLSVVPGDVVFFMGGTYEYSMAWNGVKRVYLDGGTAAQPVIYESYPGQTAIFDGSSLSRTINLERQEGRLRLTGDYAILRNVTVRNLPEYGVRVFGNHNIVEGVTTHGNGLSGLEVLNDDCGYCAADNRGSYNTLRDNIVYDNSDVGLTGWNYNDGDNADGITIHSGVGNFISHNTVYSNSDDGIDTWKSIDSTVDYNIAYDHGKGPNGNGNGIKLGGDGSGPLGDGAIAKHNIAYDNTRIGFNINSGEDVWMEFNTSVDNDDYGYTLDNDTVLASSIAKQNTNGPVGWDNGIQGNNSWLIGGTVAFINDTDPTSPDFLRPVAGGPFVGIGAYSTVDAGDFDLDGDVDGADFLAWQRGEVTYPYNTTTGLAIWQDNFGEVVSAASTATAVPEPAGIIHSILLLGWIAFFRKRFVVG